jgi:acetylornithine deacetylase/succinyl-diaminopimelate desuccinylase-like protein
MPSKQLEQIYKHIDDSQPEHIERLRDWIKQPSVSNTGEGIPECAEMTRRYFQDIVGCQKTEVVDVGVTEWGAQGNPVVYAEYDAGAPKTVILYMMYDTMPIFDVKQWRRHPYAADIIEQPPFKKVVIGHGAVNSKGPQMAMINSLNSIRAVAGTLPVNLFIIAEGDEERMSIGLRKFVHMRKDRLANAQAMLGFGPQNPATSPFLTTALRAASTSSSRPAASDGAKAPSPVPSTAGTSAPSTARLAPHQDALNPCRRHRQQDSRRRLV